MPAFSLTVDGLQRDGLYRHPGGSPEDIVVWLHGGNGKASEFLPMIRERSNIIDVFPNALMLGGDFGWAKPYKDTTPAGAPDNLTDIRFVSAVRAWARSSWPNTKRIWLAGFSSGGGLALCCWGSHATIPYGFDGCAAVGTQLHLPALNWNWDAGQHPPTALLFGNGTQDSEDLKKHFSRQDCFTKFKEANGHTDSIDVNITQTTCCGTSKTVTVKDGVGGVKPTRRMIIANLGHVWQSCLDCHTDDFVIDLFTLAGLGGGVPAPRLYPF